ncbi:ABC-F family ATP-binding cassette domain-containing protein [Luteococcus peritonei]|uniref:ABC-F family ATP-binding cassette domain-containing protein n=1 Tax=Luteococcus peritonei TaxID=88874 RepID=A0ABW4RXN9_9ACTN
MPASLHIRGLAASYGARPLFSGLDLDVTASSVVALIGPNGSGKSTLMRMVAGQHPVESGRIWTTPPDASIGHLPQSVPQADESILDYARRRTGVAAVDERYEAASRALGEGLPHSEDEFSAALEAWLALGAPDLDVRLAQVLARLGLDVDLDRPLGSLSGGQAARASLASVLVSRFDVLLLDEPTNNLDADGLALLTDFVTGVEAPVLVASHDRAFLDAVATQVCELDLPQQKVHLSTGTWSEHQAAKALARQQLVAEHEAYQARIDHLAQQARSQAEWAEKGRRGIAAKLSSNAGSRSLAKWDEDKAGKQDQKAARARAAVDQLEAPEELRKQWSLRYRISEADPSADVVLTLDAVAAQAGSFVVGPLSCHVERGDRVALVGPNGSGKTTLLQAVLDRTAHTGRISWGARTSVGVLDQERSTIGGPEPLLDRVMTSLGTRDAAETRTLLAKFGLGAEHVLRPCDSLSLGERTRAALAVLQGRAVNVLVLDEPTNHADVEAIEQLQEALVAFGGTILLVSHDRVLLDALGTSHEWRFTREGDRARVEVVVR